MVENVAVGGCGDALFADLQSVAISRSATCPGVLNQYFSRLVPTENLSLGHLLDHSFPNHLKKPPRKSPAEALMIHHGWSGPRIAVMLSSP